MADNTSKSLYGLIGYPLGHSFSKDYFNQKFSSEQINAEYINFEIPDINFLMEVLSENYNLCGLNVTIPYKEKVIPFLDELDADAQRIGAVNVIKFIRTKDSLKLVGYNSDIIGFCDSIAPLIKKDIHTKALILGTGGASKAIKCGLEKFGIESSYVSRTTRAGIYIYDELTRDIINEHKVIVNTTPLGMSPKVNECPDIPYQFLTPKHLCYDLLYNPEETIFMKKAAMQGAVTKNGLEMLLLQAFAAWNIWNK